MQRMMEMIEEQQRHNAISAMDETNTHPPINLYRLFTLYRKIGMTKDEILEQSRSTQQ